MSVRTIGRKKKKQKRIGLGLSKVIGDCWEIGRGAPSGFPSTLCTTFNQIYVKEHQYITGSLVDWLNGDKIRNVKEFWEQKASEEWPKGDTVMDICMETFPIFSVVAHPSAQWNLELLWKHEEAVHGMRKSEKCFCVVFLKQDNPFSNQLIQRKWNMTTAMPTDYARSMFPVNHNLWVGNGLLLVFFFLYCGANILHEKKVNQI